jgi:predicted nucleotidyltransferase
MPMQAKIRSKAKIISEMTDYVNSLDIIIFAYIFGSFGRGEAFSDIDIGTYLKSDLDRSFLEIEFEMEDKIGTLTGYPVDVRALNKFKKTHDFIRFRNEYLREISNAPI